ncbi:hypothetical protein DPSP01_010702 [Paraphaeosphaeria sporulosa]|uniref:Transmembrane protein n=1 Tax=Paraphaeosphaeria sporulosa TaxID=1460663 RepID=A0A177CJE8_9PLEO|nr:uncharacterized protein CC84DRAFT_1216000 [Paraphaeosphaeria sporulosa]OAG06988.1 hypothetical protein CC84DRAFT_1216000 [Paraphaeosphaeria sporulosa]
MASGHISYTSPGADSGASSSPGSDPKNNLTTSDDTTEIVHHSKHEKTFEDATQALADAAANSKLAQKVRHRDPVEAIDKPTQDFRRKRTSSAGSVGSIHKEKDDGRHDSAGLGTMELRPLTPANDLVRASEGSSGSTDIVGESSASSRRERDGGDDEGAVVSEPQFRKESIFRDEQRKEREARESIVDPKEVSDAKAKGSKLGTPEEKGAAGDATETEPLLRPEDSAEEMTGQAEQQHTTPCAVASPFDSPAPGKLHRALRFICAIFEKFDPIVWRRSFRFYEICDFPSTPDIIRRTCQDVLAREWTRHVPLFTFLQPAPPALTAAKRLESVIREVCDKDPERNLEIYEFCAGSSGPTPTFERLINQHRVNMKEPPIRFTMSDLYPNREAWDGLMGTSEWLSLEYDPVNAISPPPKAMSLGLALNKQPNEHNNTDRRRVFRLFNCSFHHFDDELARKIMESTMETSDGFAIIELQDRRAGMLLMMLGNVFFVIPQVMAACRLREHFSYGVPNIFLYPLAWFGAVLTLTFDGFVSCLRTREFGEFTELVKRAAQDEGPVVIRRRSQGDEQLQVYDVPSWEIRSHPKLLHTLPFGYVRMITGVRTVPT